jgi:hypothetical protein
MGNRIEKAGPGDQRRAVLVFAFLLIGLIGLFLVAIFAILAIVLGTLDGGPWGGG